MDFVDRHGLREARAHVLERQGKYWEAINQWFEDNEATTALDVFLRHINHTSRDPRIMDVITNFLWQNLSFGRRAWPKSAGVRVNKIYPLLVAMSKQKLRVREKHMASVVHNRFLSKRLNLIAQTDIFMVVFQQPKSPTSVKDLVEILHRPDVDNALKLWALDYLSDNIFSILNDPSEPGLAAKLLQWYFALIKEVVLHKAPWKLPWIYVLFLIKEDGEYIRITPATFLDDALKPTKSSQRAGISGALLSRNEFGNILRRHLAERLRTRITADRISSSPCVQFASHESCHKGFPDTHQPCNSRFNQRIQFHLLRIMILDELYSISKVDKFSYRISNQRYGPLLPLFLPV